MQLSAEPATLQKKKKQLAKIPTKPLLQTQKMAQEGVQVIEFSPPPRGGDGTSTNPAEGSGETETDSNDDPLVSGPINPMTIPRTSGPILRTQSKLADHPGLRLYQMPSQPCPI